MTTDDYGAFTGYAQDELGVSGAPYSAMLDYGCALLAIAGADGEVSAAELAWIERHQTKMGVPEEIVAQYADFDYRDADLGALIAGIVTDVPGFEVRRSLLYHAIRASSADRNFAEAERAGVHRAAALIGVSAEVAEALMHLVSVEESATRLRKALLGTV
jgi:uncharacterized tellurite resistance protein B-like protein